MGGVRKRSPGTPVTGTPVTGKRSPKPRASIWHVRPFFDELNEASWVVAFPADEKPPALRSVPIYGRRSIDSPSAAVRFIGIDDEYRPNPRSCCRACWAGDACPEWTADPGDGYERRKPDERVKLTPEQRAAAVLGVEWPCTEERMNAGFREATAKAHPDHGGSDDAMKRVIAARDMLTSAGERR